jgi:aspartate dehydrogenase
VYSIVYNLVSDLSEKGKAFGVGLIGCGAIGTVLAHSIDKGEAGAARLIVMYDSTLQKTQKLASELSTKPKAAKNFAEFIECKDVHLVIEAASQNAVKQYASNVIKAGKDLMIMSVGALVDDKLRSSIETLANNAVRRVYIPSGAIVGLDGLKSAAVRRIDSVTLTTRKPTEELKDVPYIEQNRINVDGLSEPTIVYEGSALQACKLFPASVNVAAALSLAGVGSEKTEVRIVADSTIHTHVHEIHVKGEFGEFTVCTKNVPSPKNPKTSYLAALSAIATLRKITENVLVGT